MKILLVVLALGVCTTIYGQVYYCSEYRDADFKGNLSTVIAVQGDSLTSYIYDVGYLWWKIEKTTMTTFEKTNVIETGDFWLVNSLGKSYLFINHDVAIQVITVSDRVFTVEYKPNKKANQ